MLKNIIMILIAIIIIIGAFFGGCASADKNITAKDYECNIVTQDNAMSCCLQNMSSRTGNDSKDVVCMPLIDELREKFREQRKKENLVFCSTAPEPFASSCWDKINTK